MDLHPAKEGAVQEHALTLLVRQKQLPPSVTAPQHMLPQHSHHTTLALLTVVADGASQAAVLAAPLQDVREQRIQHLCGTQVGKGCACLCLLL
eukprot:scaffold22198_cov15-Tisochrysis_lutea.AAC.1